jgi:ABC-type transport system involved in multi-copper enzyme maturation permease subunit
MNAVLHRELVVQARQRRTYWFRFLTGLALALALGMQLISLGDLARAMGLWRAGPSGAELFATVHTIISVLLLFTAPLIAADSIARERREGTLGLLALTPLRPSEIVLGKVGAHVIRLFSLWLVSVPVLMIPVLMGGVNWVDVKCALAVELSVLCGGLGAGLIATSVAKRWNVAAVLALGLTLLFGQLIATTAGLMLAYLGHEHPGVAFSIRGSGVDLLLRASAIPWIAASGLFLGGFGPSLALAGSWLPTVISYFLIGAVLAASTILLLSVLVAGWRVQRVLRIEAAGIPDRAALRATTGGRRLFGRVREYQRRRWLFENPARWLFAYANFAGLIRWGWGAFVVLTGTLALVVGGPGEGSDWSVLVAAQPMLMAIGTSLAAAASFRREIEEGTLELLLVTGLPARKLVAGRIGQLWSDSWPAVLLSGLILAAMLIGGSANGFAGDALVMWFAGAVSVFGAVPIGVRYAVRRLSPLHGWLWTVLTTGFPPLLLGGATAIMFWGIRRGGDMSDASSQAAFVLGFVVTQFALARTWFWLAANDLHTRLFMLKPFQRRPR